MRPARLEKHVGHELTVGVVEENGQPIGLSLDCHTCDSILMTDGLTRMTAIRERDEKTIERSW